MFCRVMEFTRRNLDKLFSSAKKLSAQPLLTPVDSRGGKEGEGDSSVAAAKGILALVESLIGALDVMCVCVVCGVCVWCVVCVCGVCGVWCVWCACVHGCVRVWCACVHGCVRVWC